MVECIESSLEDDKAQDISVIDLVGKTSIADRMIIASGNSARLVSAMSDHIIQKLKELGVTPKAEGRSQSDWVLIDAGDIIVHLFRPEVRAFYSIEKIWGVSMQSSDSGPTVICTTPAL
ncbi:MAG: ribosome silencing factor [Rhodospirillaceae bacterium]